MAAIIIGIGIGCWMYAFVNSRYNENPWLKSRYFLGAGFAAILVGLALIFF